MAAPQRLPAGVQPADLAAHGAPLQQGTTTPALALDGLLLPPMAAPDAAAAAAATTPSAAPRQKATVSSEAPAKLKRRRRLNPPPGAGFGPMYNVMRFIGERCTSHFFSRVKVIGGEDVPKQGPIIVCCSHFSTIMDVAVISAHLPHRRPIHYWAKRGLYKRQPFRWILHSSGNIMVDRKTKNNQDLFAGTFEAMKAGEAIGLFPEGGSYTEHRLHGMKAGAAWAALEFAKHLVLEGEGDPMHTSLRIVPATINYTEKSRFRGEAVFQFGKVFSVDEYTKEFLSGAAPPEQAEYFAPRAAPTLNGAATPAYPGSSLRLGLDTAGGASGVSAPPTPGVGDGAGADAAAAAAKRAVARLTDRIGQELYKLTIDAPTWKHWHATKMARELIWWRQNTIPLENFVTISNSFIKLLDSSDPAAKNALDALFSLQAFSLAASVDVFTLNQIARRLKPSDRAAIGSPAKSDVDARAAQAALPRLVPTTLVFVRELGKLAVRLPVVVPLMLVYAPAYVIGASLSLRYASHEEESMASAKSLCAFPIAFLTHLLLISGIAALFLFTPPGWIVGLGISLLIERVHLALIDGTYARLKRIHALARVWVAALPTASAQLGPSDAAAALALEAYLEGTPVQFTFKRALRQKGLVRPLPHRLTGLALAAHARAAEALDALLESAQHQQQQQQQQQHGSDADGESSQEEQRAAAAEFIVSRMPPSKRRMRFKSA